jgi:hypothetical protein
MDYGMIGKIEKAKRYAEQRDRIHFKSFTVTFDGENNPHTVTYQDGRWNCDCSFFSSRGVCSHSMALERILAGMLPESLNTES